MVGWYFGAIVLFRSITLLISASDNPPTRYLVSCGVIVWECIWWSCLWDVSSSYLVGTGVGLVVGCQRC